jgi:hypothetical protein
MLKAPIEPDDSSRKRQPVAEELTDAMTRRDIAHALDGLV